MLQPPSIYPLRSDENSEGHKKLVHFLELLESIRAEAQLDELPADLVHDIKDLVSMDTSMYFRVTCIDSIRKWRGKILKIATTERTSKIDREHVLGERGWAAGDRGACTFSLFSMCIL